MRALIVGCGSIGRRRAEILAKQGHEVWLTDTDIHYAVALARDIGGHVYVEGLVNPDVALICTPPDSGRPEQVAHCLGLGVRGLYVEKPVAMDVSDVDEIQTMDTSALDLTGLVTMGACNLRFVGGVKHLTKIKPRPWRFAVFRMGQHAKHWSPTHQKISLALDSIHELDLAVYLQGPIETIRGYSELDAAELSVHHRGGGLSHIIMDRKTDPPVRSVRIYTRTGDYTSLSLQTNDGMYEREMKHFMDCVAAGEQTCNPLHEAAAVCLKALEVA